MFIRLWIKVAVIAVLVIAFLIFARGREHRRGDEVGSDAMGRVSVVVDGRV
jgi:hypothetical protein